MIEDIHVPGPFDIVSELMGFQLVGLAMVEAGRRFVEQDLARARRDRPCITMSAWAIPDIATKSAALEVKVAIRMLVFLTE